MKKFVNPVPMGGMPFNFEDLARLQEETTIEILKGLGPCVVSGCDNLIDFEDVITIGDPVFHLSDGYVFLNGEIMFLPEHSSTTLPLYIVEDTPDYTQRTFQDGVSKNALIERKAKYQTSIPATGEYITCNSSPATFKDLILGAIPADLLSKANKTQPAFTNLTLINGASNGAAIDDVAYAPAYQKDTLGYVHLRGIIQWNSSANSQIFCAVLPVGCRPLRKLMYNVGNDSYVEIFPNGEIRVAESSTASSAFWSVALENCPAFFAEQ